jgi:TonB family protein
MKSLFLTAFAAIISFFSLAQGNPAAPFDPQDATGNQDLYYEFAEIPAYFKFGEDSLNKFLGANIKYPEIARKALIQGKVSLSFIIEKDGAVSDIQVSEGVHVALNTEAVRVLMLTDGLWIPARIDDEPVRCSFILPIKFSIPQTKPGLNKPNRDLLPIYSENIDMYFKELKKNLKYPKDAKKNHIIGRVRVKATIGEDGKLTNLRLVDHVYPSLDSEAIRVVRLFKGSFIPKKFNGKPFMEVTIPIDFTLKNWAPDQDKLVFMASDAEKREDWNSAYNLYCQLYWLDPKNLNARNMMAICNEKRNK